MGHIGISLREVRRYNGCMKEKLQQFREWYRALPEKKRHVEFITAVLSVPVMLTVIIINLNNLQQQQKTNTQKETQTEKVVPIQIVITGEKNNTSVEPTAKPTISQTPGEPTYTPIPCVKEVGPVAIVSPRDSEVVSEGPVCITIATQSSYCPVVWAYRLNGGDWSDYTDKNICLHNLTNGNKTVQVKIKSNASSNEVTLQRSFIYQGNSLPTATPPTATSSGSL